MDQDKLWTFHLIKGLTFVYVRFLRDRNSQIEGDKECDSVCDRLITDVPLFALPSLQLQKHKFISDAFKSLYGFFSLCL